MRLKRFRKLIKAVAKFPSENFDTNQFIDGERRCAGGIAAKRFKKLEWDSTDCKYTLLGDFFDLDYRTTLFLFGPISCNKDGWLERADYVISRAEKEDNNE